MAEDSKIPDGPIVNVTPASELPHWRRPTDDCDAPPFCMLEIGSGDGRCANTNAIVLSIEGATALLRKLAAMFEGGGEPTP